MYSREQSDSSSTVRREADGYIMVDFEKIVSINHGHIEMLC